MNKQSYATKVTLTVDGHYDHLVEQVIYRFQRLILGEDLPDGEIPVSGIVFNRLLDARVKSVAIKLKTDNGTIVKGASGDDALVPKPFDIKVVLKQGDSDKAMLTPSPWDDGAGATAGLTMLGLDLIKFKRGGSCDIQRLDGFFDDRYIDAATILIGMFAASAGMAKSEMLTVENTYAARGDHPNAYFDSVYKNLPVRNVQNTTIGYDLITSGAIKP